MMRAPFPERFTLFEKGCNLYIPAFSRDSPTHVVDKLWASDVLQETLEVSGTW
jgi:hypothetical protein